LRADIEAVPMRSAPLVVPLFRTATSGRDRAPAMPPKRSQENIWPHGRWKVAFLLQHF
jgi:hypothetical protein